MMSAGSAATTKRIVVVAVAVWCVLGVCSKAEASGKGLSAFHLSDVHLNPFYDPQYTPATNCMSSSLYNEDDRTRHPSAYRTRGANGPATVARGGEASSTRLARFTDDGDVHATSINETFGTMGCDPPVALLESALSMMSVTNSAPDFMLVTGDFAAHGMPNASAVLYAISITTNNIRESYPSTLVLPTIGNDDCYPDYYMPEEEKNPWLASLYEIWAPWLDRYPGVQETFLQAGHYSASPIRGLRVLSLNTIYYSISHQPADPTPVTPDPMGQFAWLQGELLAARAAGERVYIMGHIPPAISVHQESGMWMQPYVDTYLQLVNGFADIISGQFFGHTHRDEFRLTWGNGTADQVSPIMVGGALSLIFVNNPSFRLMSVDPATFVPANYTEYYFNLNDQQLYWQLEYEFSEAYSTTATLSAATYERLYANLASDTKLLEAYVARRLAFQQADVPPLSDPYLELCALACRTAAEYQHCLSTQTLPQPPSGRTVAARRHRAVLAADVPNTPNTRDAADDDDTASPQTHHGHRDAKHIPGTYVWAIPAGLIGIAVVVLVAALFVRHRRHASPSPSLAPSLAPAPSLTPSLARPW